MPELPAGLVRRGGAPLGRRLRRSPATSWSPRARADGASLQVAVVDVSGKGEQAGSRSLLLSGAFGGLLGALPADRVPAGGQRLPAPPGLERGLRHRRARRHRPADRRLRAPVGRPPARRAAARGVGPLGGARGRGPGARADAATPSSPWSPAASTAATRCCCSPTAWWRPRSATSRSGIDKLLGQGERLLREGFEQGAAPADRPARVRRTTTGRCCCCTGAERGPSGCVERMTGIEPA